MRTALFSLFVVLLPAAAQAQSDSLPIQPPSSPSPGTSPGTPPGGSGRPARKVQPEPWFRACAGRVMRRKIKSANAIFLCSCAVGAIMATGRLRRDQKLQILRSPTLRPAGATPEVGRVTRLIFRACTVRLKAVVAARRIYLARTRAGWFHKACMKRVAARAAQAKATRYCDCWIAEVRRASDISQRSKTIIVSTDPSPPVGGPPDEDKPGIRAAAKRCAPRLR